MLLERVSQLVVVSSLNNKVSNQMTVRDTPETTRDDLKTATANE